MKKAIITFAAVGLVLVGCKKGEQVNEPAGAQKDQINQSTKQEKDSIKQQEKQVEDTASQTKKQISDAAKAEKERIDADAKAAKANLEAQLKKTDADAKAAKENVEASSEKIKESAGAAATATATNAASAATSASQIGANDGLMPQDQATTDADRATVKSIRQSLSGGTGQTQAVSASDLAISCDNGTVTLKGTVKSDAEKADLESKAKAASGVKSVNNQLEVKSQ